MVCAEATGSVTGKGYLRTAGATYTLQHDIGPCPGDGLVIAADNVTLNLNGKKIHADGNGDGSGVTTTVDGRGKFGDAGVRIEGTVDLVTGAPTHVRTGVTVTGSVSPGTCVSGTSVDGNANAVVGFDAGVYVHTATNVTIKDLCIRDNIGTMDADYGEGVAITNSDNVTVEYNDIRHNGPFAGVGVYQGGPETSPTSHHNAIRDNLIIDNDINTGPVGVTGFSSQDDGVRLEPSVDDNTVENNTVTRSSLDGIAVFFGSVDDPTSGNIVRKNNVKDNGFHEYVGPGDTETHSRNGPQTANSSAPGPTGYAQFAHRKGDGIRVFGPNQSQNAEANVIGGLLVTDTADGNTVCGNAANGIRVDGGDKPTVVEPARKNIIRHNTSGGGSASCAYNDVEDAPAPLEAFDYHDGNANANVAAGWGACDSNTWSNNKDFDGTAPDSTKRPSCIS